MRESLKLSLAALVVVLLGALPVAAQTGRVGGLVKDDKGQPLKGATVVAENPARVPPHGSVSTPSNSSSSSTWRVTPLIVRSAWRTKSAPRPRHCSASVW